MSGRGQQGASRRKVAIGLVEDDAPYLAYLETLIAGSASYAVAARAGAAEEALAWPAHVRPELLLVDVALPGRSGPAAVADFAAKWPGVRIVMLSGRDADEPVLEAIRAGAAGYLLKSASSSEIIQALDDVRTGGAPMSPAIARRVLGLLREPAAAAAGGGGMELGRLSEREREVLALVADGLADKEICARLGVTRSTVKNHLTAIYDKWRVRSRTQAAVKFVRITGG
jgi:DNA-binding NarL/FixJ family response regulator